MTLENIVNGASAALKGTLAAGLLASSVYAKPADAQEPSWLSSSAPGSVCSERYDTLFSSGFEDLSQITPIGLQNCATLENRFDENLSDSNPLVVSLDGDQSYDFATLRSLSDESTSGDYLASGLPSFAVFDSEYGVTSLSPSCADQGSHLVEYNVAPNEGPGSINPLFVNYEVSCPSALSVEGLDWQQGPGAPGDNVVDDNFRFGYFGDANGDNHIDSVVTVREGRISPQITYMLASTDVVLQEVNDPDGFIQPTVDGTGLEYHPLSSNGVAEGVSGTYDFNVCDANNLSDCQPWSLDYLVTPATPEIAGLGEERWGAVTNPVLGSFFQDDVVIDCQDSAAHRLFVIPKNAYDPGESYGIIENINYLGFNESTGELVANPNCSDLGEEQVSVRIESNSGNSTYKTTDYIVQ